MISSLIVNLIGCCYFDTVCYREQLFAFWIVNRHPSRRTKNLSYKSQVMIIWSIPTHYTREIRLPSIFWSKHGHRILRPTISTECRVISDLSTVSKYFRETHPALQPWTTTKRWRWKLSRSDFIFSISTVMMGLRLVGFVSAAALALLGVLSLDTSWTTATEWWSEWEVNVLLGVKSDNVWWDIDNLKRYFTKIVRFQSFGQNTDLICLGNESSLYLHTERILHSTSWLHLHFSFVRNSLNVNQSELEYSRDYFG